jgi:hypothetical protein
MRELRVLVIPPGEPPREETIRDGLKDMQRLVGGLIEPIHPPGLPKGVMFFGNDEARMDGLPWNVLTDVQPLAGPLFAVGTTPEGGSRSLTSAEFAALGEYLRGRRLKGKSFMPPGPAFTMDPDEAERTAYLDAAWLTIQQHGAVEDMEHFEELPEFANGVGARLVDAIVAYIKRHRAMPTRFDFLMLYAEAMPAGGASH